MASRHRGIAAGASSTKPRAQIVGHADLPRCSGRDLSPGDEAIVDPAMEVDSANAEISAAFCTLTSRRRRSPSLASRDSSASQAQTRSR